MFVDGIEIEYPVAPSRGNNLSESNDNVGLRQEVMTKHIGLIKNIYLLPNKNVMLITFETPRNILTTEILE